MYKDQINMNESLVNQSIKNIDDDGDGDLRVDQLANRFHSGLIAIIITINIIRINLIGKNSISERGKQ